MDDRSATSFVDDGRHGPDPTTDGDELWRVFFLLRHQPGVYARAIRASVPTLEILATKRGRGLSAA